MTRLLATLDAVRAERDELRREYGCDSYDPGTACCDKCNRTHHRVCPKIAEAERDRALAKVAVLVEALRDTNHACPRAIVGKMTPCTCGRKLLDGDLSAAATAYEERVRAEERARVLKEVEWHYGVDDFEAAVENNLTEKITTALSHAREEGRREVLAVVAAEYDRQLKLRADPGATHECRARHDYAGRVLTDIENALRHGTGGA